MRRMELFVRSSFADRGRSVAVRAFSLAEMMVALIILGFGLLVIGAALPIGYRYTQQSTDLANGEVAVEGMLDQLEQYLRMSFADTFDGAAAGARPCIDPIARPRQEWTGVRPVTIVPVPASEPRDWWEPRIKVWPLLPEVLDFNADMSSAGAISSSMLTSRDPAAYDPVRNMTLGMARQWLSTQPFVIVNRAADAMFVAGPNPGDNFPVYLEAADANRTLPGVPLGMLTFPPIETGLDPALGTGSLMRMGAPYWTFDRPSSGFGGGGNTAGVTAFAGQLAKMKDRRVTFAVFYRRVDYGDPGANQLPGTIGTVGPGDDNIGDPTVYELIVVAMRRPTNQHRYPVYDIAAAAGSAFNPATPNYSPPMATISGRSASSPVPIPMLVSFLPNKGGGDWVLDQVTSSPPPPPLFINVSDRVLNTPTHSPETITVRASEWVGAMMPEGTVFIPAVNDDWADSLNPILAPTASVVAQAAARIPARLAGFLPHSPQTLPIYTVKERRLVNSVQPAHYLITFDCHGVYPWADPTLPGASTYGPGPADWPVWIIPPAYVELDRNGRPVFDSSATVLSVGRRIVRLSQNP